MSDTNMSEELFDDDFNVDLLDKGLNTYISGTMLVSKKVASRILDKSNTNQSTSTIVKRNSVKEIIEERFKVFNSLPNDIQNAIGEKNIQSEFMTVEKISAIGGWNYELIKEFGGENFTNAFMTVEKIKVSKGLGQARINGIKGANIAKEYMSVDKIVKLLKNDGLALEEIKAIGGENLASEFMTVKKITAIRDYLNINQIKLIGGMYLASEDIDENDIKFIGKVFQPNELQIFGVENILVGLENGDFNFIKRKKDLITKKVRYLLRNEIGGLLLRYPNITEEKILLLISQDEMLDYNLEDINNLKKSIINNSGIF